MTEQTITPTPPDWFTALFRELVVSFQPRHVTDELRTTYYGSLRDLPPQALRAALPMLRQRRFFPTSGEWRTAATHSVSTRRRLPVPVSVEVCATCDNKGLMVVRYHDGAPFDLAICACAEGQRLRRLGLEGVAQYVATWPGGRIRMTEANRIALLEDFAGDEA